MDAWSATSDPSADYLRRARRLRACLSNRPAQLLRQLSNLARHHDQASTPGPLPNDDGFGARAPGRTEFVHPRLPEGRWRSGAAHAFAEEVAAAIEGPILRYSVRSRLLRRAAGLGIGRFEANLIIACVQHRLGGENFPASPDGPSIPSPHPRFPVGWVAFAAVQGAILASLAALFF